MKILRIVLHLNNGRSPDVHVELDTVLLPETKFHDTIELDGVPPHSDGPALSAQRFRDSEATMTKLELAWAAGLFDGEGCVSIVHIPQKAAPRCTTERYTLVVKIAMCDRVTVQRVRDLFDIGTVQRGMFNGKRSNASFAWTCQSLKALAVLRRLRRLGRWGELAVPVRSCRWCAERRGEKRPSTRPSFRGGDGRAVCCCGT